jgi:hypothetical protein
MATLERRKAELEEIPKGHADPPVVRLHLNLSEIHRRKVADLGSQLNHESVKAEFAEILRSLIDRVVLTPATDAPNGLKAELYGDLASILRLCERSNHKQKLFDA